MMWIGWRATLPTWKSSNAISNAAGVRVVFRKLPSEASPTHNLVVNILGSFAEFEWELIADRTRRGRRHKVEVRKQYLGSNTAYGYRYIPQWPRLLASA